ncbi:hypothetical protein [Pseudomaricurvus sp.]|uniref:hypothetical protein n=1 Tax=Pseudomaricurvus sp. TaxID=2004510 RepID=UPI003F6CA832
MTNLPSSSRLQQPIEKDSIVIARNEMTRQSIISTLHLDPANHGLPRRCAPRNDGRKVVTEVAILLNCQDLNQITV